MYPSNMKNLPLFKSSANYFDKCESTDDIVKIFCVNLLSVPGYLSTIICEKDIDSLAEMYNYPTINYTIKKQNA